MKWHDVAFLCTAKRRVITTRCVYSRQTDMQTQTDTDRVFVRVKSAERKIHLGEAETEINVLNLNDRCITTRSH